MVALPEGEKILRICITVYTQYRRVTDRRTSCDGIVRAMRTRRAVKKTAANLVPCHTNVWRVIMCTAVFLYVTINLRNR